MLLDIEPETVMNECGQSSICVNLNQGPSGNMESLLHVADFLKSLLYITKDHRGTGGILMVLLF